VEKGGRGAVSSRDSSTRGLNVGKATPSEILEKLRRDLEGGEASPR
jgi:hypothetical protein